jgi:hypothetical protein
LAHACNMVKSGEGQRSLSDSASSN